MDRSFELEDPLEVEDFDGLSNFVRSECLESSQRLLNPIDAGQFELRCSTTAAGLTAEIVNGLTDQQFRQLAPQVLTALTAEEFSRLQRVNQLNAEQWQAVVELPQLVGALTSEQIRALSQQQIERLRPRDLSARQISFFPDGQLRQLTTDQRNQLSALQLSGLGVGRARFAHLFGHLPENARSIANWAPEDIEQLPVNLVTNVFNAGNFVHLLPGQVQAFSAQQLEAILAPQAGLNSDLIESVPLSCLEAIIRPRRAPDRALNQDLHNAIERRYTSLHQLETLRQRPPETFATYRLEQISQIMPEQVGVMNREQIERLLMPNGTYEAARVNALSLSQLNAIFRNHREGTFNPTLEMFLISRHRDLVIEVINSRRR